MTATVSPSSPTPAPPSTDAPPQVAASPRALRWLEVVPPRVLLTLAVTALISMVVLGISELAFTEIEATGRSVRQATEARQQLVSLREALAQAESSQRGYLITAEPRYLQPFEGAMERVRGTMAELQRLAALQPELREPLQALTPLVDEKLDELRLTVHYTQQGNRIDAIQIIVSNRGVSLMESVTARSGELLQHVTTMADTRSADLNRIFMLQRLGVGLIVFLNLVFLSILGVRTVRHFYERERHRADLAAQTAELERTVAERTEELSSLSTYLQTSTEREKGRLARDLHDELGGILTAAKIDTSWLEGFAAGAGPDVQQRMQRLSSSLDEAVEVKRRVIENLRPSLLDHLGLAPAVEWYVQETCGKAGVPCELDLDEDLGTVPPEIAIAVYRIVQESLTNAVKYAQAGLITVDLSRDGDRLELRVAGDRDGVAGYEPQLFTHGIAGMRQRARSLGGSFRLETAPGQGTRVVVSFPLPRAEAAPETAEALAR